MSRDEKIRNLSGQRFGMLTVEELVVARPFSKKAYRCKCDCGNSCTRLESTLVRSESAGRTSSCGCFTQKYLIPGTAELCSKAGQHRKDAFLNGSNIQMTFREGTISTNTSGVQGVSWSNTAHKWHVYVGYQSYRANLGFVEDLNDAVALRQAAEIAIKENRFEDFFYQVRGFHLGDKIAKQFKHRH